jgi:uncharacterized Zn finger protein
MDNRKRNLIKDRYQREKKSTVPDEKTQYERQQTREEVEQIKKDLRNYASSSWGSLWIQSNLQSGRPFRMQRGIEYAKDYQRIDNLSINPGQIFATVQGTAPTPYRVKINFEIIPEEGWQRILKNLAGHPLYLIELLDGSLPQDINLIFEENGYSLFPEREKPINAMCSCPDKEIPCKHIAAVILYIARVLDYNPLLLLELRGKSKNELFNELKLDSASEKDKKTEVAKKDENTEFSFNIPYIEIQEFLKMHKDIAEDSYNLHFAIKKPGKFIETVENLGNPPNIETKAFEIVLKAIYDKIANTSYKISLD